MTGFANTPVDRVSTDGGVVQVTLSTVAIPGNGGTELPCRECYVTPEIGAAEMHVAINTSTNVSKGFILATASLGSPTRIPIDDVNKLWFFGTATDLAFITYRY